METMAQGGVRKETTARRAPKQSSRFAKMQVTPFPLPGESFPLGLFLLTTTNAAESLSLETLREQELVEARAIQNAMLPGESLQTAEVEVSHAFQPYEQVGGDFLDYFALSDGSVGLYIGDVSGKGLPAALYAALSVGTLRGVHKTGTAPDAVLGQLNRRMMLRGVSHRYAAVQYANLDPHSGVLQIAGAGMPGPLHLGKEGCQELHLCGIPPGMFTQASYEMRTLALEPGDSLIFISDGITDAMNEEGEIYSLERVTAFCSKMAEQKPAELLSLLFDEVERFSRGRAQQDDRTAAVLHFRKR
jgi:sigma-B regulation protein RsbU (phosphoserine phosphatase)